MYNDTHTREDSNFIHFDLFLCVINSRVTDKAQRQTKGWKFRQQLTTSHSFNKNFPCSYASLSDRIQFLIHIHKKVPLSTILTKDFSNIPKNIQEQAKESILMRGLLHYRLPEARRSRKSLLTFSRMVCHDSVHVTEKQRALIGRYFVLSSNEPIKIDVWRNVKIYDGASWVFKKYMRKNIYENWCHVVMHEP